MGLETMHATRHPHAAESFAPGDGICLRAVLRGERVRQLRPPPDEAVNLFFDVDEWLFHDSRSLGCGRRQSKSAGDLARRLAPQVLVAGRKNSAPIEQKNASRERPSTPHSSLTFRLASNVHSFRPSGWQWQCAAKNPARCCQNQGQILSQSVCGSFRFFNASRGKN